VIANTLVLGIDVRSNGLSSDRQFLAIVVYILQKMQIIFNPRTQQVIQAAALRSNPNCRIRREERHDDHKERKPITNFQTIPTLLNANAPSGHCTPRCAEIGPTHMLCQPI
jgi:hypothetical protein